MHRRLLALCAAGALLGLPGCGAKKLDPKPVEESIAKSVEHDHPEMKTVSVMCPKDRPKKKGDTFECQVRGSRPSERAVAAVTQVDEKGNVSYAVP